MINKKEVKQAILKTLKFMLKIFPILLGVLLLISLANVIVPKQIYTKIFQKKLIPDSFIGSALGSILAGNPITSYIIGGELLKQGVSLSAVTAFIVAWVTVGLVQLPAESLMLGKRFAIYRNLISFLFAIIIGMIIVLLV